MNFNKKIKIQRAKFDRIVPVEEVAANESYSDLAEIAVIFNHDIVEIETKEGSRFGSHVWRWKQNDLMNLFHEHCPVYVPSIATSDLEQNSLPVTRGSEFRATVNLNDLFMELYQGTFSIEEHMKFYMQIGYSLSGYSEVYGQRNAYELNLPGAERPQDSEEDENGYVETILDYIRRVHKGKVLKI
jgi:hypothetical protein